MNFAYSIAAGNCHSIFLDDFHVWSSGLNSYGQIAQPGLSKSLAHRIDNLYKIQAVACGSFTSFFLDETGQVLACGWNQYQQLALGDKVKIEIPECIPNLPKIIQVSAGSRHSLFLDLDGQVWVCGNNEDGQAGMGEAHTISIPEAIPNLPSIKAVSAGSYFSLFLDDEGGVWGCGENAKGQLGQGDTLTRIHPTKLLRADSASMKDLPPMISISAGNTHSLLLDEEGDVWKTGQQFGSKSVITTPRKYLDIPKMIMISASQHSLFLDNGGRAYSAGDNREGQLGGHSSQDIPMLIQPLEQLSAFIIHISAGQTHSLFMDKKGTAYSCGNNNYFQCALPTGKALRRISDLPPLKLEREFILSTNVKSARTAM